MGTEVLKIYMLLGVVLLGLLGFGFYYVFNESLPDTGPVDTSLPSFLTTGAADPGASVASSSALLNDVEELARGKVTINTIGKNKIRVSWENLPPGSERIVIFRSRGGPWVRWKTLDINSPGGGSADITLRPGEDANNYTYYSQVFSDVGYTLWNSPAAPAAPYVPPQTAPTSTATSTQIVQGGGQSGSNPTSTPPSQPPATPTSTPTSTSPVVTPPSSTSTGGTPPSPTSSQLVAYYTPSGQIAGYYQPFLDPFWVMHVHGNIEVGWQTLPPPTNKIIVYRSKNQTGPWAELFRQADPATSTKDFVRILDFTLYESYYYRMEALSGQTILASYEPIFLPGVSQ